MERELLLEKITEQRKNVELAARSGRLPEQVELQKAKLEKLERQLAEMGE